jgi:aspartate kinase
LLTVTRQEVIDLLQADFDELRQFAEILFTQGEYTPRTLDQCAAYGERWSSQLLASILREQHDPVQWADVRKVMITDDAFTKAAPLMPIVAERSAALLLPLIEQGTIVVTQGFIGATTKGIPTTIGRGGSDYSAAILGSVLGAEEIQIWTDVDGVLTADPTLLAEARRIRGMTFQEASELAYFGAQVLHPSTILPAVEKGIPVRVLNSHRPNGEGTLIAEHRPDSDDCIVKSIAYKEGITVINVHSARMLMNYGFLARVFDVFARYHKSIDVVTTSEVGVSITVDSPSGVGQILEDLREFSEVSSESGKAVVCVVGERMRQTKGIAARVFSALDEAGVNAEMISHGGSDINLTFVIEEKDILAAVRAIHSRFFSRNVSPEIFDSERESSQKLKGKVRVP